MNWAWLVNIFKPLGDIGTQALKNRAAKVQATHVADMTLINNRQALAVSSQTAAQDKEITMLQIAKPWMRWVIAGHVFALLDLAIIAPDKATEVFQALNGMPDWLIGLFLTIMGFYFAVSDLMKKGVGMVQTWRDKKGSTGSTTNATDVHKGGK